jgi:L-ascorbate metabolism protein UlaG (beta-lactamase superfamily)
MKVQWLGHASFLLTSDSGVRIITDPYQTGGELKYAEVKGPADAVTVSHEHHDHNYTAPIGGNPQIIRGAQIVEVKGIKIKGVATSHDDNEGKDRGANTIFCFNVDGVNICHLGDLGHKLSDRQVREIGPVDVLITPTGGKWAIDAKTAAEVANQLKARVIIPMHFRNEKCNFPIAGVDDFLTGKKNVIRSNSSEIEFKTGKWPAEPEIIVLKSAL